MDVAELLRETYAAFAPPKNQTVSEWADENRMLVTENAAAPGKWKTSRAPYQKEIMDAFTQPGVHEIVVMASAQVGKSEIELNMLGRAIDLDPGPILYVQPTKDVAEDYSKRRIAPMIEACPVLKRKVSDRKSRDSDNTITMKLFPGGSLNIIGANSPSDLSSKPIRYLIMDEIDRFPASAGTEGNPIKLAEKRTETYRHNRKIVMVSTPTLKRTSKIEKEYMKGTQEEWRTECPHCGHFSFIQFDDVKFDVEKFQDESGETDYIVRNTRWQCPVCKRETAEAEAKRLSAKWYVRNGKAIANGVRSFRLNAFMSPWSDWKSIALEFLHAKDDPAALQVFHNTTLGESWETKLGNSDPEKLMQRREAYSAEVPNGVLVLTMGVDIQDNRLEYEVVGWNRTEESWGICRGVIPGRADSPEPWEEIDRLLDREWKMANGMTMRILATFVDSGGHMTTSVYKECAKRAPRRVWAIKGDHGEGKPYVRLMKKAELPPGTVGFMICVDSGKEAIMYSAGLTEPGDRYMHFPTEPRAGYNLDYFRGLLSEKQVFKRKQGAVRIEWEKIYERNEPLDCRNYARACYRYFNWNFDSLEKALRGETEERPVQRNNGNRNKRCISRGISI